MEHSIMRLQEQIEETSKSIRHETSTDIVSTKFGTHLSQKDGLLDGADDDIELPFAIESSLPIAKVTYENFQVDNCALGTTFSSHVDRSAGDIDNNDSILSGAASSLYKKESGLHSFIRGQLTSSVPALESSDGSSSRTADGTSEESVIKNSIDTVERSYSMTSTSRSRSAMKNNINDDSSRLYDSSYLDAAASLLASRTSSKLFFSTEGAASMYRTRLSSLQASTITSNNGEQHIHPLSSNDTSISSSNVQCNNQPKDESKLVEPGNPTFESSREEDTTLRYRHNNAVQDVFLSQNSLQRRGLPIVHEDQTSMILGDNLSVRDFINDGDTILTGNGSTKSLSDDLSVSSLLPMSSSKFSPAMYTTNLVVSNTADGSTTILPAATPLATETISRLRMMQQQIINRPPMHRSSDQSLHLASLAGAIANRTGNMSFQVSIIVNTSVVESVIDIVANPELLRLWCNPIMSGSPFVITRCSEGARTATNRRETTNTAEFPYSEPSYDDNLNNNFCDQYLTQQQRQRQYDGEWIEATTVGPVIEPPSSAIINIAGSVHKTCQLVSSAFGCPQYGRVSMFVERQKGQVSYTIGPFAGNIEVHHRVRVVAVTENTTSTGCVTGKVRIIDDVRLQRFVDENEHTTGMNETTFCSWNILGKCYFPSIDDHMNQTINSMAQLRFLIEIGASCENLIEPQHVEFDTNIGCRSDNPSYSIQASSRDENLSSPLLQKA